MSSAPRRVVITGLGAISPLGNSKQAIWDALTSGRSGVAASSSFPPGSIPVPFGAEAREFKGTIDNFGPLEKEQTKAIRKGLKVMCRECQMGVAVAQLALSDAGLAPGKTDPERTGVAFGVDHMLTAPEEFNEGIRACLDEQGRFAFPRWGTEGMPKLSPLWLLKYLPNMPASHVAIYNDFRGPNNSMTLREAAAHAVLGEAYQIIVRGHADTMVVGATGTRLHAIKTIHAVQQEEVALEGTNPARVSRPFDLHRTGMVLGEGAGAVVLEELSSARARGATIYAEVLGGASSAVSGARRIARRDVAMKNALTALLAASGMDPEDVGFIQAHGLSTRSCDVDEARAIGEVFGGRSTPVPVTAAKSYFGNLGAGSGMIELIAGTLALQSDCLYPVLNYEVPDPQCPLAVVTNRDTRPGSSFIALSVTPQGQASAAMVARLND